MKKINFCLFVLSLAISANAVWAGAVEITPFVGYMFNSGLDVTSADYSRLRVDGGTDYGFTVGTYFGNNISLEFMFNRQNSGLSVESTDQQILNLSINQYDVNFLYNWGTSESTTRPYVLFGLGSTHFNPHVNDLDLSGLNKFNLGLGAGVKTYFGKHFGLRGEFRYTPTYLNTTDDGFFCDAFGCYVVSEVNRLHQVDITAGTIFRF